MDIGLPYYHFFEEQTYKLSKAQLGLDPKEVDEHLTAIQDAIINDPHAEPWSLPLATRPGVRVAVSDATHHAPNALRVLFRVEGDGIKWLHVERR